MSHKGFQAVHNHSIPTLLPYLAMSNSYMIPVLLRVLQRTKPIGYVYIEKDLF